MWYRDLVWGVLGLYALEFFVYVKRLDVLAPVALFSGDELVAELPPPVAEIVVEKRAGDGYRDDARAEWDEACIPRARDLRIDGAIIVDTEGGVALRPPAFFSRHVGFLRMTVEHGADTVSFHPRWAPVPMLGSLAMLVLVAFWAYLGVKIDFPLMFAVVAPLGVFFGARRWSRAHAQIVADRYMEAVARRARRKAKRMGIALEERDE